MHTFKRFVTLTAAATLIGVASPVWAESAPVFDVDSFDAANNSEPAQEYPLPPAPGEEGAAATTHPAPSGSPVAANPQPQPQQNVGADVSAPATPANSKPAPAVIVENGDSNAAGVSVTTDHLTPEQRLRRMEQQLSNMQNGERSAQVETLQNEVQTLRGQVEQLNHELEKVHAQQKVAANSAAPTDVDNDATSETDNISAGASSSAPVTKKPAATKKQVAAASTNAATDTPKAATADKRKDQPNVAEEQKIYQTAYDFIKAKKYNEAVGALEEMVKKYPSGQFASNAHYWLGELYGLLGKNSEALAQFNIVIDRFPGSPRISDAQLKVGLILATQSKWADAKRAFKTVINSYPGTASARLASEQLKQIKTAGH